MSQDYSWEPGVEARFNQVMGKVPVFMRPIAQQKVFNKILAILKAGGRNAISEKDMVDAFFDQTPFGFHGPMKTDMEEFGIDYTKYGYSK